jgi:hypothetical protein
MMEPADLRQRYDRAPGGRVDGARIRRILAQGDRFHLDRGDEFVTIVTVLALLVRTAEFLFYHLLLSIVDRVSRLPRNTMMPEVYTEAFRRILGQGGVNAVRLPARSPNLNAFAERFVLSIKTECLDRLVPLGEAHLRRAILEYTNHYHEERNHQGLHNEPIVPSEADRLHSYIPENRPHNCRNATYRTWLVDAIR